MSPSAEWARANDGIARDGALEQIARDDGVGGAAMHERLGVEARGFLVGGQRGARLALGGGVVRARPSASRSLTPMRPTASTSSVDGAVSVSVMIVSPVCASCSETSRRSLAGAPVTTYEPATTQSTSSWRRRRASVSGE